VNPKQTWLASAALLAVASSVPLWADAYDPLAYAIAKGTSQAGSDLDLLVIRPNQVSPEDSAWEAQTLELVVQLERLTGYPVQLVEYSESEFQALVNRGARLVTELSDTGMVVTGELELARREAS
jgi:hypothetical protein